MEKIYSLKEIKEYGESVFAKNDFVQTVFLFGSYARGEATANSDLDFIVETNREIGLEFYGLYYYLQEQFKKNVDVLTSNEARELGKTVEKEKVLIYER